MRAAEDWARGRGLTSGTASVHVRNPAMRRLGTQLGYVDEWVQSRKPLR